MAPSAKLSEIKLEDIDFDRVKECTDKNAIKQYIKLLEDDGSYFTDLLKACKDRLLEVAPKDYYLLYPRCASEEEVEEVTRDLLNWQAAVKETDAALQHSKKDVIWDDTTAQVSAPIRGQEPVRQRPHVPPKELADRQREDKPESKKEKLARDKTNMKDYYSAWDKVDVDALEADLEREQRELEESRRRHFEELREVQEEAQAKRPIPLEPLPSGMPEAHRKHMAESEKEKGNEAFYSKDWEEAEAYYTRSLHFSADDPSTWANRALVRLKLKTPQGALEDCEHALALNSRYMKALHRKGKALYELRRYEDAVRYFQLALAESPGNTQINGDLMVARKALRREGPSAAAAGQQALTMLEPEPAQSSRPPASRGVGSNFHKVLIEETSDSEDDDSRPPGAARTTPQPAAPVAQRPAFGRVQIEEVSDSDSELEAQPVAAALEAPAAQAAPAATATPIAPAEPVAPAAQARVADAGAPPQAARVCFDDMD